ncbi:hypothetical protein OH738_09395 [Streptomyces hirsutus]|uniref:Transposase n=1 Tax=Streptomyces hirsutus TaxID=35620 RepID=A0ABZ1GTS8_9ACTN|nr:hypothetical protein [Streptomyces hirsutus]WSD09584.1 hypothetical protein OIE73_30140 [Streptomyces hirsutus]WTD16976.1 hypothetical protein OH738_09395 [Streptomyces hirsutus]
MSIVIEDTSGLPAALARTHPEHGTAKEAIMAAGLDEMVRAERAKNYKGDSAHHNEEDPESRPSATEGHHVMSRAPPPDCGDA